MSRSRLGLCLGSALALALAACTTPQPAPSPSTSAVLTATATNDVNAQPRERVRDGGLLRVPIRSMPTEWNPRSEAAAEDASARRVLEPLDPDWFLLDAAGRPSPNPDFVESVDVENKDVTTVRLRMNPKAVWGDGTPIAVADWVATAEAYTRRADLVELKSKQGGWDRVAEVSAGGASNEVVVRYRGVDPDWAQPLVDGPARAGTLRSASDFTWDAPKNSNIAAPFRIAHVDRTQGLVTLERNPVWWGDAPKLEQIMFRTVRAEALAAAFQHNELDVWETGSSSDRLQQMRAALDTTLRSAPGTSGRRLKISSAGVLADVAVRRALLLALDRDAIGASDLADSGRTPATWSNNLMLPSQPGYVDQARSTGLGYDPAQARKVLDEAGWIVAEGVRTKDGQELEVTFRVDPADPVVVAEFAKVKEQLAAVGVRAVSVASDAMIEAETVGVGAFPMARSEALPGVAVEQTLKMNVETDVVRRADLASQVARAVWQEVPSVPLYQVQQFVAVRNGVANLGAPAYSSVSWEDVGWTA